MRDSLSTSLGSSLAADRAAEGVDYQWMQEFAANATGSDVTFRPAILGFGAVIDTLSAFLDRERQPVVVAGLAASYVAAWIFLAGGIIDQYARGRAAHAREFFAASGAFFFRFLRLGAMMALAYGAIFRWLHPWLFATLYVRLTREITVEREAFLIRVLFYVVLGAALAACNILFDYAKVRAVVEDRYSMTGAVVAAVRFIGRNFAPAAGLYIVDVLLLLLVLLAYALVAPGAGGAGLSAWAAFLVGQAYVAARLWVKLVFWASETSLVQAHFASPGSLAPQAHEWPESPRAEALGRP